MRSVTDIDAMCSDETMADQVPFPLFLNARHNMPDAIYHAGSGAPYSLARDENVPPVDRWMKACGKLPN